MRRVPLFTIFLTLLAACGEKDSAFERISYNEGNGRQQYFTYYVRGYETLSSGDIPSELRAAIDEHSLTLGESDGKTTSKIFYYVQPGQAPNITGLPFAELEDVAAEHRPILAVAIGPTGSRAF